MSGGPDSAAAFGGWFIETMGSVFFDARSTAGLAAPPDGPRPDWMRTVFARADVLAFVSAYRYATALGIRPSGEMSEFVERLRSSRPSDHILTRQYALLRDITFEESDKLRGLLSGGLARGATTAQIIADVEKSLGHFEKARIRTIVRTEVVAAHAESTLSGYEELGVGSVAMLVEATLQVHGRASPCALCIAHAGTVYTIADARGIIPLHPNCQCGWVPVDETRRPRQERATPRRPEDPRRPGQAFPDEDETGGARRGRLGPISEVVPAPRAASYREALWRGASEQFTDAELLVIEKELDKWLSEASPYMRVPKSALPKILNDGRFKSLFETGKGKGATGATAERWRKSIDAELFGAARDLPAQQRPIYGYFSKGTAEEESPVSFYGELRIKLKPQVRERTTWMGYDSLDGATSIPYAESAGQNPRTSDRVRLQAIPSPVNDPRGYSAANRQWMRAKAEGRDTSDLSMYVGGFPMRVLDSPGVNYVEAQYWGGVSVNDIEEVRAPRGALSNATKSKLTKLGIRIDETSK